MKKILLLLSIFLLGSCNLTDNPEGLSYQIFGITEKNDTYELSLALSRPDLHLKQSQFSMSLTDLQKEMRITNLSLNGMPCLIERTPFKCETEDLSKELKLKADFPDTVLETVILPRSFDFSLSSPEITHPLDKDDKEILVFKSVFADFYEIKINACYDEENCQVSIYDITKEDLVYKIHPRNDLAYFSEIFPMGDSLKAVFKYDPSLFSSVEYTVTAFKEWPSVIPFYLKSEKTTTVSF